MPPAGVEHLPKKKTTTNKNNMQHECTMTPAMLNNTNFVEHRLRTPLDGAMQSDKNPWMTHDTTRCMPHIEKPIWQKPSLIFMVMCMIGAERPTLCRNACAAGLLCLGCEPHARNLWVICDMAMGQGPNRTPSEHPNPTTKIKVLKWVVHSPIPTWDPA